MKITEGKNSLNRSISNPDVSANVPICRRIYMEEFYYPIRTNSPIVRQFSCEQSIGNNRFVDSKPHFNANFFNNQFPSATIQKYPSVNTLCLETSENLNDSPMDVDIETSQDTSLLPEPLVKDFEEALVASTPNVLDSCEVSYRGRVPVLTKKKGIGVVDEAEKSFLGGVVDGLKQEVATPKVLENCQHRVSVLKKSGNKGVVKAEQKKGFWGVRMVGVLLIVVFAMFLVRYYDKIYYDRSVDVEGIRLELEENVVNQEEEIRQIVEYFELASSNRLNLPKNILVLFGTNGVGKTHSANLIKKRFKPAQVFDFDLTRDTIVATDFHRNVHHLLVLDNLRTSDLTQVNEILKSLPNSKILPILIFNNQYLHESGKYYVNSWEVDEVQKGIDKDFVVHLVRFNSFTKGVLRGLLKDFAEIESVFDGHDFEGVGLKGFFAKVLLVRPDLKDLFK